MLESAVWFESVIENLVRKNIFTLVKGKPVRFLGTIFYIFNFSIFCKDFERVEGYSEPYDLSKMKRFTKKVNAL